MAAQDVAAPHEAALSAMTSKPQPGNPIDLGALDFEFTDLTSARKSLEELPAGIEERKHLEPGYWEARRRKHLTASDRALTGAAIDWLLSLPEPVRPKNLCEMYPRVANTVADTWSDRTRATVIVDRLINDDRGGTRKGFPAPVKEDLVRLLRYLSMPAR